MSKRENDNLLKDFLNLKFMDNWDDYDDRNCLELQITADCNLKCKYCYLNNFGDKIYPFEIRKHDNIFKNLHLIMQWVLDNNFKLGELDLFSGEIWYSQFGWDILNIIYEYLSKYKFTKKILIPSNVSFLMNDKATNEIQNIIEKFKNIGVRLIFSLSLDGKIVEDDVRAFKSENLYGLRNDEYYERAFKFAKKNCFGFHPMVAASSIEKWIENYNWWIEQFKKYKMDISTLMMLEVRNDDWTKEKIDLYLEFLEYVIDYKYEFVFNKDKVKFAIENFGLYENRHHNNSALKVCSGRYTCKLQEALYVRLGDLCITPCHRTSYDKFNYGKFVVENDKIVDIEALNPELAINILGGAPEFIQYKCPGCAYKDFCIKGCLGAQYESTREIFMPCKSVCDLYKAKIKFLIKKYNKLGLFDAIENSNDYDIKFTKICKKLLEAKSKLESYLEKEE